MQVLKTPTESDPFWYSTAAWVAPPTHVRINDMVLTTSKVMMTCDDVIIIADDDDDGMS